MLINPSIIADIQAIIANAQQKAARAIDSERVLMYWQIGKVIFEEEQQGKDRADYGTYLIKSISTTFQPQMGSGFSVRQLEMNRQFYRMFPNTNALRSQFNWTHYILHAAKFCALGCGNSFRRLGGVYRHAQNLVACSISCSFALTKKKNEPFI